MNGITAFVVAIAYAAALFALAAWAERRRAGGHAPRGRAFAYTLALGVYCTSWTYYGAVGSAVAEGWTYLPILLGPILVYLLAPGFLARLIGAVQREGATSISDFIGSRFGKSRGVAALVTLLALAGTVPYLALQLRSVGMSYAGLTGGAPEAAMMLTALVLAAFAILFGTRRYDAAGRNEGVLVAVAAESLVKLVALLAVGALAVALLGGADPTLREAGLVRMAENFAPERLGLDFVVVMLLSAAAIVCLPRQFYIGVIEASAPENARRARWPFAGYLALTAVVVLPIATAGLAIIGPATTPDLYVLGLPAAVGAGALSLFVFLGGFSAATGMVIVESIALSTMISNDLVAPLLLRSRMAQGADIGALLLKVRRLAILLVMGFGLGYALLNESGRLAAIGLVAFAAMAQFAPALLLAVSGSDRDAAAAKAGLGTGLVLWLWTLLLPTLLPDSWLAPVRGTLADPEALLGLGGMTPLTHGALISVGGNLLAFALISARRVRPSALPRPFARKGGIAEARDLGGLIAVVARFAEPRAVSAAFGSPDPSGPITPEAARTAERLIARVVGAPSARAIMATALSGAKLRLADVARMLDEGGQSLHFSKGLLASTLEHIEPGVSVVDRDLNLVAWNSRYLAMFDYPPDLIRVGVPVAELIRYNALRGECGPGEVDAHVERRLENMRRRARHSFERIRPDGRVLKTVGGPMPGGGYVMCFSDITAEAEARAALIAERAGLEQRVAERTQALEQANAALSQATREKTRFLAAASHDLLQPLHAARLFSAALARDVPERGQPLLAQVDRSILAADTLLRALLDISKLDAGGIVPVPVRLGVRDLLLDLAQSFAPLAAERGLRLRVAGGDVAVETDAVLLRSIVQNFMSNALRYTQTGGVLVAARRRGASAVIEVYDTGPGIPPDQQERIFREFERLHVGDDTGVGLGLAIVERTAKLVGARIELRSEPGRGSRFSAVLPAAKALETPERREPAMGAPTPARLNVLVVDDQQPVREATAALLKAWDYGVVTAEGYGDAIERAGGADVALIDLQLGDGPDGLAIVGRLRARHPRVRVAIVTADRAPSTAARIARAGVPMFQKPIDTNELADWLAGLAEMERAAAE